MNNNFDPWNSASQLPLVPYLPGDVDPASKNGSIVLAETAVRQIPGLPLPVVSNVLRENYSKRVDEAVGTSEEIGRLLFDGSRFRDEEMDIVKYAKFREIDANFHATLGERVMLFLSSQNPLHMNAYEVYAKQPGPNEELSNLTFATTCFKRIVEHLNQSCIEHDAASKPESSHPKLGRLAEVEGRQFAVVTSKVEVGTIECANGDIFALKSRKAGAFMLDLLAKNETRDILTGLINYRRDQGRSEELMQARMELARVIENQPDIVRPVVESLYLARVNR